MKTKTQHSARGVFAVSIIMAIVLWTLQQTLVAVPADVQASDWYDWFHPASPEASLDETQTQVSSRRDSFVRWLQRQIQSLSDGWKQNLPSTVANVLNNTASTGSSGVSWAVVNPWLPASPCTPSLVTDISWSPYESDIQRAIKKCLVQWYDNQKFYPDNNLTHQAMILIAQRAWYTASLMRWANEVVTKSELLKFIDYLQESGQIGLVPSLDSSTIVSRGQYIRLIRLLRSDEIEKDTPPLPSEPAASPIPTPSQTSPVSVSTKQITVAQFKTIINQSLSTPLPIQAYDDKVMITEDIMKSILESSQPTSHETWATEKIDLGINKELVKESLARLIQKM